MIRKFQTKLGVLLLMISIAPAFARADYLYTVTVQGSSGGFVATQFSFNETAIAGSGDVTSLMNISGSPVKDFSWDVNGNCIGGPYSPLACAAWIYSSIPLDDASSFPAGSFLALGTYSNLISSDPVTVAITTCTPTASGGCAANPIPEPSSLLLLASGTVGLIGLLRGKKFL